MKTTALLCDYAQVSSDGKLFINGANITRLNTPVAEPPLIVHFALAVIVEVPWDKTNQPHKLTIELVYDGGDRGPEQVPLPGTEADGGTFVAQFNAGRGPDMVPGETTLLPIALPFQAMGLPAPGGYSFKVNVDGAEEAHVPFQARVVGPMGFIGR